MKRCKRDRDQIVKQIGHIPDVERGRFVATQAPDGLDDLHTLLDDPLRIDEKGDAFRGQAHVSLGPVEEADADFFFEILDLSGERRLREMQSVPHPW